MNTKQINSFPNQPNQNLTPIARADELIRYKLLSSGFTQSTFLSILVLILALLVCFDYYLSYFKLVYYTIFSILIIFILICIFYY
jgi:hypothetical protein